MTAVPSNRKLHPVIFHKYDDTTVLSTRVQKSSLDSGEGKAGKRRLPLKPVEGVAKPLETVEKLFAKSRIRPGKRRIKNLGLALERRTDILWVFQQSHYVFDHVRMALNLS